MSVSFLIADDSTYARMMIKQAVNSLCSDAVIQEAKSGKEVLDIKGQTDEIDWYLLDVNMGEPDGFTTATTLVEGGVDVKKITLITANKSSDLQKQAEDIGLNCIIKTMNPDDFDAFIDRLKCFFDGGGS